MYSAGNLMQLHLRDFVQRSVDTITNYFRGFPTLATLKKALASTTLRKVCIIPTSIYNQDVPVLKLPEIFYLQDHLNPIFRLSVNVGRNNHPKREVSLSHLANRVIRVNND